MYQLLYEIKVFRLKSTTASRHLLSSWTASDPRASLPLWTRDYVSAFFMENL